MNKEKKQDIEFFRIICAFGIIWYHSASFAHEISYSALLIFIMLSCYLTRAADFSCELVKKQAIRILVPWVIWFAIYAAINMATHKPPINLDNGLSSALLAGSSIHLWYLPFIFFICLAVSQIKVKFHDRNILIFTSITSSLILLSTCFWRPFSISLGYPYAQYFHALAGVLIGICFSYIHTSSQRTSKIILLSLLFSSLFAIPYAGVGTPYIVAIIAFYLLCTNFFSFLNKIDLTPISCCMLGVYLIHPIIIRIVKKITYDITPLTVVLIFLISTMIVMLLRRKVIFSKLFI